MNSFTLLLVCIIFNISCSQANVADIVSSAWSKLWDVTCEHTTKISRTKRSIELPDLNNVDEFFDYLYPSLHLKIEDLQVDGARSLSLASWWDDALEYWTLECNRHTEKNENKTSFQGTPRSKSGTRGRNGTAAEEETDEAADAKTDGGREMFRTRNVSSQEPRQSTLDLLTGFIPSTPIPLPTFAPIALREKNTWFQNYGGDIEYFFPLIGWGIPFDGEISLLGFHGFKGIFPYKK